MARDIIRSLPVTKCKIGLILDDVVIDEKAVNLLNHITLESAQRRIRKLEWTENGPRWTENRRMRNEKI